MSTRFGAKAAMRGTCMALAALLLLAQALALIHLGTVSHLIDLGTGRVVHATAPVPHDAPTNPTPQGHHDPCAVYTALTQSATTASPVLPVPLVLPSSTGFALPPAQQVHSWRRELHRLSPAHSPPATT